MKGEISL